MTRSFDSHSTGPPCAYKKPLRPTRCLHSLQKETEEGEGSMKNVSNRPHGSRPRTSGPALRPDVSCRVALPVKMRMMITAKMSGFSASTPGAFRAMCVRANSPMGLPISSSNVALQALATLEVPAVKQTHQRKLNGNHEQYLSSSLTSRPPCGGHTLGPGVSSQSPVWASSERGSVSTCREGTRTQSLHGPGEKHAFHHNPIWARGLCSKYTTER